jgi:4,5:9,10-diseco-3-hydroxy-5,9,17-trioxoandrosta-1(10),2-diene-4-oate hydrolase
VRRRLSPTEVYPAHDLRVRDRFITVREMRTRIVEAGPADGRAVILIPGWASSAFEYRKNTPALADAGFRVVAVDLPGQGESDKPVDRSHYTVESMVAHLRAVLDALGVERASLVGQSLGGTVAMAFARESPERVERLVLIAPVGLAPVRLASLARAIVPPLPAALLARLGVRAWWSFGLRHAYGDRAKPTDRDIDEYWAPSRDPRYVAGLLAFVRGVDWRPSAREVLAKLSMAVLVVAGTRDRLIPIDEMVRRAKWLPNAELVVIEGAGHPIQEEVPDEVNDALVRFLRS